VEAILEKGTLPQLTGEKLRMLRAIAVVDKAALGRMERRIAGR
jgi:hypothetical protein